MKQKRSASGKNIYNRAPTISKHQFNVISKELFNQLYFDHLTIWTAYRINSGKYKKLLLN